MPPTLLARLMVAFILGCMASLAYGQAESPDSPKLSEHFTFNLSPQRDFTVNELVKTLERRDEIRSQRELESANAGIFSKTLDLLRFVPIRLRATTFSPGLSPVRLPNECAQDLAFRCPLITETLHSLMFVRGILC